MPNSSDNIAAEKVIEKLGLEPHPEGGYFREVYRAISHVDCSEILPKKSKIKERAVSTAIYYLITPYNFSSLHRIPTDEIFHFYAGSPVEMVNIDSNGKVEKILLGNDIMAGQIPQFVVKAGNWQGVKLCQPKNFALMGCTVAPAFEFEDLEISDSSILEKIDENSRKFVNGYLSR